MLLRKVRPISKPLSREYGYLTAFLLAIASISVSFAALTPIESNLKTPVVINDHFFFIGNLGDQARASKYRTKRREVQSNQSFGFRIIFTPVSKVLHLQVRLRVPHSPERFPATHGNVRIRITPDRQQVIADEDVDGSSEATAFYWGINSEDPSGDYELKFSLDGSEVDTYKFIVK